jgi:hypothetical protein
VMGTRIRLIRVIRDSDPRATPDPSRIRVIREGPGLGSAIRTARGERGTRRPGRESEFAAGRTGPAGRSATGRANRAGHRPGELGRPAGRAANPPPGKPGPRANRDVSPALAAGRTAPFMPKARSQHERRVATECSA